MRTRIIWTFRPSESSPYQKEYDMIWNTDSANNLPDLKYKSQHVDFVFLA